MLTYFLSQGELLNSLLGDVWPYMLIHVGLGDDTSLIEESYLERLAEGSCLFQPLLPSLYGHPYFSQLVFTS